MADEKVIIEIFSEKERGEACWSWCLKKDDQEIARCTQFTDKDTNRDHIKRIQTQEEEVDIEVLEIIEDGIDKEKVTELIVNVKEEDVCYKDPEEDPVYQAKHIDDTLPKGVPGS